MPSLLLQPLVENAIKHGVARKAGLGHIDISARREGDKLRLEVRDDGVGLSEDALTALQKGIGVSTTRARLQHLFGATTGSSSIVCRRGWPWSSRCPGEGWPRPNGPGGASPTTTPTPAPAGARIQRPSLRAQSPKAVATASIPNALRTQS